MRVYGDRLVDDSDTAWLVESIRRVLFHRMEENLNKLFVDLITGANQMVSNVLVVLYCVARIVSTWTMLIH